MSSTPGKMPEISVSCGQKRLVRESFELVREYADSVVLLFYGRLFEIAPEVRSLFKIDVREQAHKMMETLRIVVEALDRLEELRPQLAELGRRHADYGVSTAHYAMVRSALLWALGLALERQFDVETRGAWDATLAAVSQAMLEGAGQPAPRKPASTGTSH